MNRRCIRCQQHAIDEESQVARAYLCPLAPRAIVLEVGPFEPDRWSERDFIALPVEEAGRLGWRLVRAEYEGLHAKYMSLMPEPA